VSTQPTSPTGGYWDVSTHRTKTERTHTMFSMKWRIQKEIQFRFLLTAGVLLVLGGVLGGPPGLCAQASPSGEHHMAPRLHVGGGIAVAQPLGEFNEYVRVGGGILGFGRLQLDERGLVSLRLQGGFLTYGRETERVCLSETVGCRIEVDLTTSNNILLMGIGPELGVPLGNARMYGNAMLGFDYFSTDSQVSGSFEQEPFASTRNFGDGGLSWNLGGGLELPIARARAAPIALDVGLSYQGNGRREYLTRGDIRDRPDGSLEFDVKRSDANFLVWRLGVSVGIPGLRHRP